jgi:hypothetical protein
MGGQVQRRVKRAENILSDTFDANTIILQLNEGVYFELNDTGSEVWKLIPAPQDEPVDINDIVTQISDQFDWDSKAELINFIHDFVIDLERNHLVSASAL